MYDAAKVNSNGTLEICGSFDCNGSSAPVDVRGKGFTVSAAATGVVTITLDADRRPAVAVIQADAWLSDITAANSAKTVTVTSTANLLLPARSFTVTLQSSAGTAADIAASTARCNFRLLLRMSNAGRRS